MLGYLQGNIIARLNAKTLIQTGDIGYWVYTGAWQPSDTAQCYLHQHQKEDGVDLYGFVDLKNLELFELLISVSGVGRKSALNVLALGEVSQIVNAITQENDKFIALASGVGKKAAQKIILDLKSKLKLSELNRSDGDNNFEKSPELSDDLLLALESLGWKQSQIAPYLAKMPTELVTLEDQVKWFLSIQR